MGKRQFRIDTGTETILVEGHAHKNVAVKYLMKRRRSLLGTKDPNKIEVLYSNLPTNIRIIGKQLTHEYKVNWEKIGSSEYQGSRFVFTMDQVHDPISIDVANACSLRYKPEIHNPEFTDE